MSAKKAAGKANAREVALLALMEVEQGGAYANFALKRALARHDLNEADRRLTSEIVYGSLRMQAALDHILAKLLSRPLEKLSPPIRHLLRLSLYQLHYMERLPQAAVVHQAVELAKRYGHKGTVSLTNGVLRAFLRQDRATLLPDESDIRTYISITLSYPQWLTDYLLDRWPKQDVIDFCLYHNRHQGIDLRVNTLRISRDDLLREITAAGMAAQPALFAPEALLVETGGGDLPPLLEQGKFIIQGQASQLVAHALYPAPDSAVIDLCAAPGGKTTHLAQLMQNRGEILAVEIHPHRLSLIEENAQRLGVSIISTMAADGRALPTNWHSYADYVMLDAPCSGLGVLGRRADARWRKQPATIQEMAELSLELLCAAAVYVKPGGYLCYSTCTITDEENTDNIRKFLAMRRDFSSAPMSKLAELLPDEQDKKAALNGSIQLLPQRQGMEGFFISLMRKSYE